LDRERISSSSNLSLTGKLSAWQIATRLSKAALPFGKKSKQAERLLAEMKTVATLLTLQFEEAAEAWLESRQAYISAKTFREYKLNIKTLSAYFGMMKLTEISSDQIRAYQKMRLTKCGPTSINHECSVLQQMLKRVQRWGEVGADYQPLPLPKTERGRALSDEEKKRLFEVAEKKIEWRAAYCFALISVNTSAGPKETFTLRLKDINLDGVPSISVQPGGAKNVHRIRTIPLNEEALLGVQLAMARARKLGSTEPDHYLFPYLRKDKTADPTRHQTTFKTAWKRLTAYAELVGFRMYDLRHHAITTLLENPKVSEEVAEHIAGHISRRMKKRYSHARLGAMREAVEALGAVTKKRKPPRSAGTEDSTDLARQLSEVLAKLLKTA